MRLYYKILLSFLVTIMVLILLMIGIMHLTVSQNLADYLTKMELNKLDEIMIFFQDEYSQQKGWKKITQKSTSMGGSIKYCTPFRSSTRPGKRPQIRTISSSRTKSGSKK